MTTIFEVEILNFNVNGNLQIMTLDSHGTTRLTLLYVQGQHQAFIVGIQFMIEDHRTRSVSRSRSPSGRAVGLLFAGALALVSLWAAFVASAVLWPALIGAGAIALCAFMCPERLAPLARVWISIGTALHRVFSPILIALLFAVVVVPMSLLYRILRRDPMKRHYDPLAPTYWKSRSPKEASSLTKQF